MHVSLQLCVHMCAGVPKQTVASPAHLANTLPTPPQQRASHTLTCTHQHATLTHVHPRSIAFRQLVVITACILLVRFALNNVLRFLARWSSSPVQWDKSKLYYVMKEVCA